MTVGTPGFVGGRLRQARRARGIPVAEVADHLGLSPSQVYNYESGLSTPPPEVFSRVSKLLRLPKHYFLKAEVEHFTPGRILYRAKRSASSTMRERAQERLSWLAEVFHYMLETVEMPSLDLPPLGLPANPRELDTESLDQIAYALRNHWGLGQAPVTNVIRVMEANGFIVSLDDLEGQEIDGLSAWSIPLGRPFAVLNAARTGSSSRRRFSAAHELGELVLHRDVNLDGLSEREQVSVRKLMDAQANRFAGAFLLPEQAFLNDLNTITLSAMQAVKPKWKVSIAAMVMRVKALGLVDEVAYRNLMVGISRRDWRVEEPFDDEIPLEEPVLLRQAFQAHTEAGVTGSELVYDIGLDETTLNQLALLPPELLASTEGSNVLRISFPT